MGAHDERLRRRIKARECIGAPIGDQAVSAVARNPGVGHGVFAGQFPSLPEPSVVAGDLPRAPSAPPAAALRTAPHAGGPLTSRWRDENGRPAGLLDDAP